MAMALYISSFLRVIAVILATITSSYAYSYITQPLSAVEIFEFARTPTAAERDIFDTLMCLLGAKVCFISFAIYASALFASNRFLGCMLIGIGGMAYMEGLIVLKLVGHGEWNHWGYGRAVAVVGVVLLGLSDRK